MFDHAAHGFTYGGGSMHTHGRRVERGHASLELSCGRYTHACGRRSLQSIKFDSNRFVRERACAAGAAPEVCVVFEGAHRRRAIARRSGDQATRPFGAWNRHAVSVRIGRLPSRVFQWENLLTQAG